MIVMLCFSDLGNTDARYQFREEDHVERIRKTLHCYMFVFQIPFNVREIMESSTCNDM